MKTNVRTRRPRTTITTHEGAPAVNVNAEKQLRRSVMSCLLWEDSFYEDGHSIADRIVELVPQVRPTIVRDIAIEARTKMNLRHVPLLIARTMLEHEKHRAYAAETIAAIVLRADEPGELIAMYKASTRTAEKPRGKSIPRQMKLGLQIAFRRFDAHRLGKYNGSKASVKLRDVLRVIHAKPENKAQSKLWKSVLDGTLASPDTWEVALSAGKDKKATWTRLVNDENLGALATLRNLRNMTDVGVDPKIIRKAIAGIKTDQVLPFRFIAAARHAPSYEAEIEDKFLEKCRDMTKLTGETIVLVDVSGSMMDPLSGKSDMNRLDAACGLAMVARELCKTCRVFAFSTDVKEIPARRGFALRDAIVNMPHGGTNLGSAVASMPKCDRLIVITDEQSHDRVSYPTGVKNAYMINVASNRNGVGYGKWCHIDGFSEGIFAYLTQHENDR